MHPLQSIIRLHVLLVVAPLVLLGTASRSSAQILFPVFDFRLGQGSTLTDPARRSIFLSMPLQRYSDSETFVVYLEQSFMVSEEHRGLDLSVGVSPMFRVETSFDLPRLSLETGVGVNVISTRMISGRQLGSNLLFGPTLSAGIEMPWEGGYLGVFYTFRHLSNASMFEDNDGINFQFIVFSLRFARH